MISLRSRILIALTVLAGAGALVVWHWLSTNPCVDDSALEPPVIMRSVALDLSTQPPLLRLQDDTGPSSSGDSSAEPSAPPAEIPCQTDMLNRNAERGASALLFLVLFCCSVMSVAADRRALRRHRWATKAGHRQRRSP